LYPILQPAALPAKASTDNYAKEFHLMLIQTWAWIGEAGSPRFPGNKDIFNSSFWTEMDAANESLFSRFSHIPSSTGKDLRGMMTQYWQSVNDKIVEHTLSRVLQDDEVVAVKIIGEKLKFFAMTNSSSPFPGGTPLLTRSMVINLVDILKPVELALEEVSLTLLLILNINIQPLFR
jgi:hypothetical protein